MGLEAATFINQLVAANPVGATDPKSQGDDHLRLIKSTLQATFAAITGAVTATHTELNQLHAGVISSVGNGTNLLPAYSFASDPDTGMYRSGANALSFAVNGVQQLLINTANIIFGLSALNVDGAVGAPAYSFASDTNTGAYHVGADRVGFAAGGVVIFDYYSGGLQIDAGQLFVQDGTAGAPGSAFTNDTDTGFWRDGANTIGMATGGVNRVDLSTTSFLCTLPFAASDGTPGAPAYSYFNDLNTGAYRGGADDFRIAAGGIFAGGFVLNGATTQTILPDGTAALAGLAFLADLDTGFYRDTANQIGIGLGGATAGQIAQGTFVAALTGCTTAPTVTVEWQRIGNIVHMYIPLVTATSNSTACTLTGMPAAIRPATHRTGLSVIPLLRDNGADASGATFIDVDTAGTISFYKGTTLTGFTNVNGKGLPVNIEVQYKIN